jgi:hypothetical protein
MAVFSKMLLPIALPLLSLFNSATAAPAASGTFNALTLNVAGLPPILNDNGIPGDKETNTKLIGTYFAQYNYSIIHVQEDFNFHAALYSTDTHPYRTGTSGGVPFGSGLNTLSVFNWVDFVRTKWATCSIGSGDCLTPKGFTFMRIQVSQGVWVDAYNLHADAGTDAGDLTARAANLKQVSDYITANSGGNAVLVFGDTNSRYTRAADIPGIFASANGMTDAWVQLAKGGVAPVGGSPDLLCSNPSSTLSCEIVDKLWYHGSPALTLTAKKFDYVGEKFLYVKVTLYSSRKKNSTNFVSGSQMATSRVTTTPCSLTSPGP